MEVVRDSRKVEMVCYCLMEIEFLFGMTESFESSGNGCTIYVYIFLAT